MPLPTFEDFFRMLEEFWRLNVEDIVRNSLLMETCRAIWEIHRICVILVTPQNALAHK